MSNFHSAIFNDLIEQLVRLPSVGRKSALRLALHIINMDEAKIDDFILALRGVRDDLKICSRCNNIADQDLCAICLDASRSDQTVCVVENIRDLLAIEETGQYNGRYYVLNGLISPIEGIGPEELGLDRIRQMVLESEVQELVLAVSPTFEGDTTVFYISKILAPYDIKITTLARGVSFGSELEYTDEITLGRSLQARVPYDHVFNNTER